MKIYTRKGDSGDTGLLFGGARVGKDSPRIEAAGTVDEAVAALGVARAAIGAVTDRTESRLNDLVIRIQRELFVVGAEIATHKDRRARLTDGVSRVTSDMVTALESEIDTLTAAYPMPAEFVVPGESMTGAAFDLARAITRRAERRAVALAEGGDLPADSEVGRYLNRLADLLFVMARVADGGFRPVRGRA
ncbi:MAG: cob(I)yrinic acid a,c-diamide adenosyltransferase [Candidatus Limnocylindria bacterium]